MKYAAVDFETYYTSDYSLKKISTWNYVFDKNNFDAYLVSIHNDDLHFIGHPKTFDWRLLNKHTLVMHNAHFDGLVMQRLYQDGVIPKDFSVAGLVDTADMAAYLRVPRNLKGAAKQLLGQEMDKGIRDRMRGKTWDDAVALGIADELLKYSGLDAEISYKLWKKFGNKWPLDEQRLSELSRESCWKGVTLDKALLGEAITVLENKVWEAQRDIPWCPDEPPLSPRAVREECGKNGMDIPSSLAMTSLEAQIWEDKYAEQYPWVKAIRNYRRTNILYQRARSLKLGLRDDGTFPFQIKYYGANTGRFCLPGSAEVLTPTGWRELQHWKGTSQIMQWEPFNNTFGFRNATANCFPGAGKMIQAIGSHVEMLVTPEHKIPYYTGKHKLHVSSAQALFGRRIDVPVSGVYVGKHNTILTPTEARILVAVQADSSFYTGDRDTSWLFGFHKHRKFDRLCELLTQKKIQYRAHKHGKRLTVAVQSKDAPWYFSKEFNLGMLLNCASDTLSAFMDEVAFWDGSKNKEGGVEYVSTSKNNAETVATIAHLTGRRASINLRIHANKNWPPAYRVYIVREKKLHLTRITTWKKDYHYKSVYCPSTETGYFLCRYKGNIFITGNSGGGDAGGKFNMQNMPRDIMFGVNLRPIFVSRPGHTLIVCDYSQIEARLLLWRVGDFQMLDRIRRGESIYEAHARIYMGWSGGKLKKEDPKKYALAKSRILGLGYGCSKVKFKGLAKSMCDLDLTEAEAGEQVKAFRDTNQGIVKMWLNHQNGLITSVNQHDPVHEIQLASGRILTYFAPRRIPVKLKGRDGEEYQRDEYYASVVKGEPLHKLYGAKLTENEIQATGRDLVKDGWIALDKAGYNVLFTVHDEYVIEVPDEDVPEALLEIPEILKESSPWAETCPIDFEISSGKHYEK